MSIPNVIIEVNGGLVAGVVTDVPVNVYVVDHDIEGFNEEDLREFPVAVGRTEQVALVEFAPADKSKGFVNAALKALGIKARK